MPIDSHVEVAARRALEMFRRYGTGCVQIRDHKDDDTVLIRCGNGQEWLIPWSRFEAARCSADERGERFEIHFTYHLVTIEGENLRELFAFIRRREIVCLRALPSEFRATVPSGEPFITRLELKVLSEKNQAAELSLPF